MKKDRIEVNGIHLSYQDDGTGQPMILIHGKGYSKENMNILFNHYKDKYHVFSYDVRGHGESDKPAQFTLEDDVQDLFKLIDTLKLKKPICIGFSMGSYITLKTAEEYPALFSKIVLIGTKGRGAASSTELIEKNAVKEGLNPQQAARQMMQKVFAPETTMGEIKAFDQSIASSVVLNGQQKEAITKSLQNFDLMTSIKKVQIPVLVLTGEYDGINPPAQGKKVASALPNGTFHEIENAGHIAFFENPNQVFRYIDTFLK